MPSLILTGWPCVGKTRFSKLLCDHAIQHKSGIIKSYVIINEELVRPDKTKAQCYETQTEEKITRCALKTEFERQCSCINNKNHLVILDSMNYIKGYRYELYCISKASETKHGVIWLVCPSNIAKRWNNDRLNISKNGAGIEEEIMNDIIRRFEPPDQRNRWDKPLYRIDVASTLIYDGSKLDCAKYSLEEDFLTRTSKETLNKSVYDMHYLSDTFNNSIQDSSTSFINDNHKSVSLKKRTMDTCSNACHKINLPSYKILCNKGLTSTLPKGGRPISSHSCSILDFHYIFLNDKNTPCEFLILLGNISNSTNIITNKISCTSSNTVAYHRDGSIDLNLKFSNAKRNRMWLSNVDLLKNYSSVEKKDSLNKFNVINKKISSHTKSNNITKRQTIKMSDVINELLSSFLLDVESLKESISTKIYIPVCSDVIHDISIITQFVVGSILNAQKTHDSNTRSDDFRRILSISLPPLHNNLTAICCSDRSIMHFSMLSHKHLAFSELSLLRRAYIKWITPRPLNDISYQEIALSFLTYIENRLN